MISHVEVIKRLGGGTECAKALSAELGQPIDREAVYKWQERNLIPAKYWPALERLAKNRRIPDITVEFLELAASGGRDREAGPVTELTREIEAFESMKDKLEKHHPRKWVVVHEGKLIGAFDTLNSAASEAVRRFGRGPYLIRQVGAPPARLPTSVLYHPIQFNADR